MEMPLRTLVCSLFMSVDGVIESPDWFVAGHLAEDISSIIPDFIAGQDAVLLGRRQYEEWAEYWPSSSFAPFADFINPVEKHVVSSAPLAPPWTSSRAVLGDQLAAIAALKAGEGGAIGVHGSITLVHALLGAGLVDQLRLVVFPALAGRGRRLLETGGPTVDLRLAHRRSTPGGIQLLIYDVVRREEAR